MISTIALCLIAYLMGSVSCAILVCLIFKLPDPRQAGSKNPGATNVLRLGGKLPALLTLLGDVLKGFIPVLLGKLLFNLSPLCLSLIGLAAFMGHLFPIFFRFQGGKGVATYLGILFAIHPLLGLTAAGSWLIVALCFRYSSVASLAMAFITPFYALYLYHQPTVSLSLGIMSILIFITHRSNIKHLFQGTERRINAKRTTHANS